MTESFYAGIRKWLGQSTVVNYYRRLKSARELPKYSTVKIKPMNRRHKSIIFLCPATNVPRGGVKVIYHQAAVIKERIGLVSASILHPMNPEFNCTWFKHQATFKRNLEFDPKNDFVMIPEFMAIPHARLLYSIGVKYGIYVQGGYIIGQLDSNNVEERDTAYLDAALILAISDDTVECIKLAFPECAEKVHRVHCSVNPDKFVANSKKENIISYMPRRLNNHSQLVTFFLSKLIPTHWKIVTIDGLNEEGVAAILGKSKIFLSFSALEGFSLPPLEAALSGCHVIGYTGEGAKEYWDKELFTEIYSGDIKAFVKAVLNKIDELDNSQVELHNAAIQKLVNKYSAKVEIADMQDISQKIIEILDAADQPQHLEILE